ncbi:complement resistance protein TraT [Vibrio salinus]|uniref:complement resistance protein TraT n=1 Tax=Vibrio salinus TaxID=2899784 RepID=UPI001E331ADF|nr:complement resistance protein TraT [Vibrio salinus]MCE0492862.1 complement resistance protein TraT [Vibrio salinus]
MKYPKMLITSLAIMSISLTGCSAMKTAVKKRNLEVKTQMSQSIWLDPTPQEEHTIFLQVKNTTDKNLKITDELKNKLEAKGYKVLDNPKQAHYWIQANLLKADKMDLRDANNFLSSGYGAGLAGGALGALAVASSTSNSGSIIAGGLIGSAVGFIGDSLVEDINYSLITDVRIVEKSDQSISVVSKSNLQNGNANMTNTNYKTTTDKKRYQTRIVSNANKVNLDFDEARPALIDGLTTSISGLF